MKKFDIPSDEFLRESLRDYRMTPSDAARNAFLKEASGIIQSGRSSRRGWILPSLLLLLAGFAWVIWTLLAHEEVISTPVKQEVSRQNSVSTDSPPLSLTKSTPASASSSIKTTTEKPIEAVSVSPAEAVHSQPHSSSLTQSSSGNKTKEFPESSEFKPAPATTTMEKPIRDYGLTTATPAPSQSQPLTNQDPATSGRSEQNPAENASLVSPASPATSSKPASALTSAAEQSGQPATPPATVIATEKQEKKEAGNIRRSDHRNNNGRVAGGVFYTPEWLHNTLDGNNIAHNFGLEGVFRYGGFSIRTGAGISIASGANEIEVAYKPYLGDYRKLDSIQFTWSDPEHKYIPKNVYVDAGCV
ncbi:MAG TPA: hypothetical protein PKG48_09720 [Bacteroidales bacterium]|nr:hypothetical protein [Bacteroidales bacterium]